MEALLVAVGTDGKVWVGSDYDQLVAKGATITHVYEVATAGWNPIQIATVTGTNPSYTVTSTAIGADLASKGTVKIRK